LACGPSSPVRTEADSCGIRFCWALVQIYKEGVRDLLAPKNTGLKIRELPTGEVYVQGLSDEYVSSSEDIMQLLSVGEKSRTTASTGMNEVSSRSHSVLIIIVNQKLKDGGVRVGKLNLADLAGSERIERTNATGETLEEAKVRGGVRMGESAK
jgi:kinesin family protein 5